MTDTTTVEIPGAFYAEYRDGKVERFVFTPSAGGLGYTGPSALVSDGDEALDVETDDGPFWTAVQTALITEPGRPVPFAWEE